MFETDITAFAKMLEEVWSIWPNAKPLTSGQATVFFRALANHPLEEVRAGFDRHVRDSVRGKFAPVPSDINAAIEGIVAEDGRPGPEEAWSISTRSLVEADTVIWTDEMALAWGVAKPIMDLGDEVGARMAFRETYNRLVDEARKVRRTINWTASLGMDRDQRQLAIAHAVNLGRLPPPQVPLLEGPTAKEVETDMRLSQPVTGLGQLLERAPPWVREKLKRVSEELAGRVLVPDSDKFIDEGIRRTNELREISQQKYLDYLELLATEYKAPPSASLPPKMRKDTP